MDLIYFFFDLNRFKKHPTSYSLLGVRGQLPSDPILPIESPLWPAASANPPNLCLLVRAPPSQTCSGRVVERGAGMRGEGLEEERGGGGQMGVEGGVCGIFLLYFMVAFCFSVPPFHSHYIFTYNT